MKIMKNKMPYCMIAIAILILPASAQTVIDSSTITINPTCRRATPG